MKKISARAFDLSIQVLPLGTMFFLLWVTMVLNIENFDGFEYLLSGMRLWGDTFYWHPKNALLGFFCAFFYTPFGMSGSRAPLLAFHIPFFALSCLYLYAFARWMKLVVPQAPFLLAVGVVAWNRVFIHLAPFSMPDISCGLCVLLWFWIDRAQPLNTFKGKALRALSLALIALGRQNVVLIPTVTIAWNILKTRQVRPYLEVGVGSLLIFFPLFGIYFAWGTGHSALEFLQGIDVGIRTLNSYFAEVRGAREQQAWIYLEYIFLALTPVGIGLFGLGFFRSWKEKLLKGDLAGPSLAALAFLLLMMTVTHKESRYLMPIFPVFAAIQVKAILFLAEKRRWAGALATILLFISIVPELLHFTDPFYRSDVQRKSAEEISKWSKSEGVVFLSSMAAFYPKQRYYHWNETAFYVYHWSYGAFAYFTGRPIAAARFPLRFEKHGYPIPDGIEGLVAPGVTMILPKSWPNTTMEATEEMPPLYALRWSPIGSDPAAKCEPKVTHVCIEVLKAFPGGNF